ncbi:DUF4235 domain-containing protein [Mumia sp. zg.B53]|uniref:DUF4235 domain-containing protein n=1 Tax=unclassified Mumia TaxID=2621872 RepID=UPI001C6F2F81|nr:MULTISPECIES: DUF4235 domain-containing protein [unclassified Mumia]MBW9205283.1 DUF4235 domain-containing protein [Mumia sp. zg.B17]MBW9208718.1 DUF4235 domain-containing protein [Mumia sp. zg.B21]MBW9213329.1 DUF4235 domain-containing protein [Mumia sp. zg.B53]MDD9349178.1 DUF4235 domain-containing protein [Mumia sp.]
MARSTKKAPTAKGKKSKKGSGKAAWKLLDRTATVAAGVIATQAAALVWRAATGRKPPTDDMSRDPAMATREAVAWAVLAGASAGLIKVVLNRQAVNYWVRSTGDLPPGVKRPKA